MKRSFCLVGAALTVAFSLGTVLFAAEPAGPQSVIRETLHSELHGLSAERSELKKTGEQSDSPLVQAYLGNVRQGGNWLSLEDAVKNFAGDGSLKAYADQRSNTRDDFAGNVAMADWCTLRGMTAQANAHLLRALDFEPDNIAVRQRLGHVWTGSQWLSPQELAEQRELLQEQAAANQKWSPIVASIRQRLLSSSQGQRNEAARELKKIDDSLAIPTLEAAFAAAGDSTTLLLLEILGGMSDVRASESLARLAVLSRSPVVREKAAELLGKRDRHSWIPQLLAAMKGPVRTRAIVTVEPDGRLLYRHEFTREGQERNEVSVMDTRVTRIARAGGSRRETLAEALRRSRDEAFRREWQAQLQTFNDQQLNDRIAWVLRTATGEKIASTPQAWWDWWNQTNEAFNEGSKPSRVSYTSRNVAVTDYVPDVSQLSSSSGSQSASASPRTECFVAGTPVWTARGEESIEKVRVGDLALSQNMETGELEYKPVVRTTQRAAARLVRVTIGNDVFECTGGHLFWVIEQGWTKARDLKAGMVVHGVKGTAIVAANEEGIHAPTYNLVVADHHNYFVGVTRCLTHDNTPRRPTTLVAPGVEAEE